MIGLACAFELHKSGADVTVLERGALGAGVSGGNTGWVVPSMTPPLPAPGMVREGLRLGRWAMQPARGYSVTIAGSGTPPRHALHLAEARIGLSPYQDAVRIAGVFERGAGSAAVPPGAGERLLAARPYLSAWRPEPNGLVATWAGLRPATADGLPLIGELPGRPGLYVAAGHGMLGVTLAPATAALLAPLVLHGQVARELEPFDPARRL